MGGRLVDGEWTTKEDWEKSKDGSFARQESAFRDHIEPGGRYDVSAGRYHLYVSYACPWAHRTLIARALLGLEDAIDVSIVHPFMGDHGWEFRPADDADATADMLHGARHLYDVYTRADSDFTGRVTVPVLWDRAEGTIVNNESREILRMFRALRPLGNDVDLCPDDLRPTIDDTLDAIYEPINNGVYRCGFAGTQEAYERAFATLFEALAHWDEVLADRRYLCGDRFTEADICMYTTLIRFDPVYYVHFKCNGRLIRQFPHLSGYLRELWQMPALAETTNLRHIKEHYYTSHPALNPKRFVPVGPDMGWLDAPHQRG